MDGLTLLKVCFSCFAVLVLGLLDSLRTAKGGTLSRMSSSKLMVRFLPPLLGAPLDAVFVTAGLATNAESSSQLFAGDSDVSIKLANADLA